MSRIAMIFPDHAACYIGMGDGLTTSPEASAAVYRQAADLLGYSVADLCKNGPDDAMTRASRIHAAVVTTNLACLCGLRAAGIQPVGVAGHSVGEIAAAVAADSLSVEDALRLAARQGTLLEELQTRSPGAMATVLGIDPQDVEDACAQVRSQGGQVYVAQKNSPTHAVVAGTPEAVRQASEACTAVGAERVIPASMREAWHTPLMASVATEIANLLTTMSIHDPAIPFVSGSSGQVLRTANEVRTSLSTLIQSPVQWRDAMETVIAGHPEYVLEVGGRTKLGGMERYLMKHMRPMAVYDRETLTRIAEQLTQ